MARAAWLWAAVILSLGLAEARGAPFVPWDGLDGNAWIYFGAPQTRIHMYTANAGSYEVGFDVAPGTHIARGENALRFSYGGAATGHMESNQWTGSLGVTNVGGSRTFRDLLVLVAIDANSLPPDFSFSLGSGGSNYSFVPADDFSWYSHPEYATGRPCGYYSVTNPQGEGIAYDFAAGMVTVYAARNVDLAPGQTVTLDYSFANLPGDAVFSVYGYDANIGWIYHTNRGVIDVNSSGSPVSTFAVVVPEPCGLAMLACGAAWAWRRRWRRG